jgi:GNAT superfamily N-acetyltransferase
VSAQRYADVNAPAFQPIFPFFPGIRTYRETKPQELWWKARAISGYPELEWTYPHMANRVVVAEQLIPAHFYESVSSFDKARLIVTLAAHLHGARKRVAPPGVELGFRYFDSTYYAPAGVLKMPDGGDPYRGQHSALARYHEDPDVIAFFGWRQDWGDSGIGYMSREYFDEHVTSAMASWVSMGGPSRAFYSKLEKRRSARTRDILRAWSAPNHFQAMTEVIAGASHRLLYWEVYSLETERPVDVVEIRRDNKTVARMHVYHDADRQSSIRELYVVPDRRRHGYAAYLEAHAQERARIFGSDDLELWLHEADARPRCREAAEGFGSVLGYEWETVERRMPTVVAIGRKKLR